MEIQVVHPNHVYIVHPMAVLVLAWMIDCTVQALSSLISVTYYP